MLEITSSREKHASEQQGAGNAGRELQVGDGPARGGPKTPRPAVINESRASD